MGHVDRRRLEDARLMFERMLGYANHLGLYAEQTGPRGEALGKFPPGVHSSRVDQRRVQSGSESGRSFAG